MYRPKNDEAWRKLMQLYVSNIESAMGNTPPPIYMPNGQLAPIRIKKQVVDESDIDPKAGAV